MKSIVTIGHLADIGLERDHQEDAYGYRPFAKLTESERAKGQLFVVADGVGGQEAGEVASKLAVETILQQYYAAGVDAVESLRLALLMANQEVYATARKMGYQKMATTVVCAVIRDQELIVGHVGDSRAYLWRLDQLQRLTVDHSWVAEQIAAGALPADAALSHPYRSLITRSLGNKPDVLPVIRHVDALVDGDRILLCTDGLYDGVPDARIAQVLRRLSAQDACRELVCLANDAGGTDNISVMVLDIQLVQDANEASQFSENGMSTASADNVAVPSDQTEILVRRSAARKPDESQECEIVWSLPREKRGPNEVYKQISLPESGGRRLTCKVSAPAESSPPSRQRTLQIVVSDGLDQKTIALRPRGFSGQPHQGHPDQMPTVIVDGDTSLRTLNLGNIRVYVDITRVKYHTPAAQQFTGLTARFRIQASVATDVIGTVSTD